VPRNLSSMKSLPANRLPRMTRSGGVYKKHVIIFLINTCKTTKPSVLRKQF
ncbi:hypothetical protein BDV11DRAFT_191573, partial [Aspergillus similis]